MNKEQTGNEIERIIAMYDRGDIYGAENRCNELLQLFGKLGNADMVMQVLACFTTILSRSARYTEAEETALRLLDLAQQDNNENILQKVYNSLGVIYYYTNRYDDAYRYYNMALDIVKGTDDRIRYASILTNFANLQSTMGKTEDAIEHYFECIAIAQDCSDANLELGAQINIGHSFVKLGYYEEGLEHNTRALHLAQQLGNMYAQSSILHSFGVLYMKLEDHRAAEDYLRQAAAINEELNNISWFLRNKASLANLEVIRGNFENALAIERDIEMKMATLNEPEELIIIRCNIARTLIHLFRYEEAESILLDVMSQTSEFLRATSYIHSLLGKIYSAEDSDLFNAQKAIDYLTKAVIEMEEKQDREDLTPYKLLSELYDREGNVVESMTMLRKYVAMSESKFTDKEKELAKKIKIEKNIRKKEIESQLLTNIAPVSIVDRMMKGERIADYFSSVSIIFIDLVNFTSLSQNITPEHLLEFLNTVFSIFDECAVRHGVEKIKTIGDAYMAVAGIPKWTPDHALRAGYFACEILSLASSLRSPIEGISVCLRIGISSGEAIAGIIGTKRLSYDLWGDAVNTAARMESHGEAGRIHCSEEFVNQLTMDNGKWKMKQDAEKILLSIDNYQLSIIPRGEMEIKGKGTMRTYFLEKMSEP